MTPSKRNALDDYAAAVRQHYGTRLVDILIFGDARPDSDLDRAVVLEDGDWKAWDETMLLLDLGCNALLEPGLWIQAWPVSRSLWNEEDLCKVPLFVIGARPKARPLSQVDMNDPRIPARILKSRHNPDQTGAEGEG